MTSHAERVIVIAGPTGVGKTHVALELARRLGGELIGADSVQVYRGFDIGSAKPTRAELGDTVHHLIDIAEPEEDLDAARYAELASAAIQDVSARGRVPIVVGGTGLWLRALLRGLVEAPPVDRELRAELERTWDELGPLAMHARLAQVDARSAARIHANDKLRVVRALEVHAQTGKALGELRDEHALGAARYADLSVVLDLPRAPYTDRIRDRTRQMFARGFPEEVAGLLHKHGPNVRAMQAVGYRQMAEELTHGTAREVTLEQTVKATCVYARRQRTWWKSDPNVQLRLTAEQALAPEAMARYEAHLAAHS
ncbi:MAG TPA: tRNA (adenosine(37)-N6)-dimethylallyltransferase MiaA [Polyangiales bacterium]|nr:tRNA (adenosine(37)-N6)-dimethylallyltransferase MiaA [Polyangiales bacterium]